MPVIAQPPVAEIVAPNWSVSVEQREVEHWAPALGSDAKALRFLVRARWTEGEARERSLAVSDADAKQAVDEPTHDGLTRKDLVYASRITLETVAIHDQITQPAAQSVTPALVDAYVGSHPRTEPERRQVWLLRARTTREARAIEGKFKHGLTWSLAARRYPVAYTTAGPKTFPKNLERALFKAPKNRLTRSRTYVFKVARITPSHPTSMATQRATAWEILASDAEQQALDAFNAAFAAIHLHRVDGGGLVGAIPHVQHREEVLADGAVVGVADAEVVGVADVGDRHVRPSRRRTPRSTGWRRCGRCP